MKKKSVLLYCTGTDDVLRGSSNVAGIQVQMSFWAKTFVKHGWKVFTFSNEFSGTIDGIEYIHKPLSWLSRHGLSFVQEIVDAHHFIKETKTDLVLLRGGRRDLYAIERECKRFNSQLVFLGASDRDFEPGKELFAGAGINVKLYRKALHGISGFITQNQFQADNLLKHYGKQSTIIPNIWIIPKSSQQEEKKYDALWVANLRRLKRAEWFINLAKQLPQYRFAIVGGVNEQSYYDAIKEDAAKVANLDFLGAKSLDDVNSLLSQSKILVCTSEFEGFPNTFLQAWAQGVPVISTVNPSGCISDFKLGGIVETESQLLQTVIEMLTSPEKYSQCQQNIKDYFMKHHDADMAYQKIMDLIKVEL